MERKDFYKQIDKQTLYETKYRKSIRQVLDGFTATKRKRYLVEKWSVAK